jgi:hypothetical protein
MINAEEEVVDPSDVSYEQILYMYEMAKNELNNRRIENRKQKIIIANLRTDIAGHEHAWNIREGELREQFIRESRRVNKALEQHMKENTELKKSIKEKDATLTKYLSDNNNLKNENSKLKEINKNFPNAHKKDILEIKQRHEEEIRKTKVDLARAVKIKINALEVKHKQELFIAAKRG